MLGAAIQHFHEDIQRAISLLTHGRNLPAGVLRDDIFRASWMMAVGACDAYFCDAYGDLIARALQAKELEPNIDMPDRLNNLRVPVIAIIRQGHGGWRWRMAARELIEDENVLALEKIKKLFNQFFREKHKILTEITIGDWILHRQAKVRTFGVSKTKYRVLTGTAKNKGKKVALKKFHDYFEQIFQRRHDCIHNCDRPKMALQRINDVTVEKRIQDVTFLVDRCHEALIVEFPHYLSVLGFGAITKNRVCA